MHISLGSLELVQSVQSLRVGKRRQGGYRTDLCLSSGEHGGTVNSGDDVNFSGQRTDLRDLAAVGTLVIFQDHLADGLLLILIYSFAENLQPVFVISQSLFQLRCHLTDILFSCLLVIAEYGDFHLFGRNDLFDLLEEFFRNRAGSVGVLLFAAFRNDLVDEGDNLLVHFMSLVDCLDHLVFRNLVGAGLDHDDFFSCGGNCQLQIGDLLLGQRRVDDKFTVNETYLRACAGTVEGDIGNAGGNGGTQHSRNLRIALRIH